MTGLVWVPTRVQPVEEFDAVLAKVEGGALALYGPPGAASPEPLRVFVRGGWIRAEIDAHDGSEPTVIEPLLP